MQNSLFQVFNTLVRASSESREAVLQYFARVINLNVKRAGLQVGEDTIATDSFMVNLQTVLYRLAEPFMDANYTKVGIRSANLLHGQLLPARLIGSTRFTSPIRRGSI